LDNNLHNSKSIECQSKWIQYNGRHLVMSKMKAEQHTVTNLCGLVSGATDYHTTFTVNAVHLLIVTIILHRVITSFVMKNYFTISEEKKTVKTVTILNSRVL